MRFIINPGSGPVSRDADSLEHAYANMARLLAEAGIGARFHRDADAKEDDGRFAFLVTYEGRVVSVDMPGIPAEGRDQFHYPRLYINGSSWFWHFAVRALRRALTEEEDC